MADKLPDDLLAAMRSVAEEALNEADQCTCPDCVTLAARPIARSHASLEARVKRQRTALLAQRAYIQHWLDDVSGNLKPTVGSLREALEGVEAALKDIPDA